MSNTPDMSLEAIVARANERYRKNLKRMNYVELAQELEDVTKAESCLLREGTAHSRRQAATFAADAVMVRVEIQRRRQN